MRSIVTTLGRKLSTLDRNVIDLLHGASVAGVLKALSAVLSFGLSVVLGRALGVDGAGLYFLAFTTVTIASTIGRFGLDSAVLRQIAAHASANEWADVRMTQRAAVSIGFVCSTLTAAALYVSADDLAIVVFSDATLAGSLRIMSIAVLPLSLSVLISRALLGLSRVRDAVLVFSILPTGGTFVGTLILAYQWGVQGAIVAYVAAVTGALAYGLVAWYRISAGHLGDELPVRDESASKRLLKSGPHLLIGALLQLVLTMSGALMLGIWSENSEVGLFSVAWRTAMLITFVLLAVNTIAQPKFAALFARREMHSLATTANKATILMTICAAPVLLVFLFAPDLVMSAFGSDFSGGARVLQVLAVGQFVNVAAGSVGILLIMSGHEKDHRNVQIVAAAVVLSLNTLLIPSYGAVGAAIAAATALILQNFLFGYFVWARLGIITIMPKLVSQRAVRNA